MHPRIGVPLAVILVLLSAISYMTNDQIDEWIKDNSVQIEGDEIELLGLQKDEMWPVLIADFDITNSDWGPSEAEDLLIPKASNYFKQISSKDIELDVDVYPSMTIPKNRLEYYGADSGDLRDSTSDGTHLPMELAREVIEDQIDIVNWSKYDLDNDGWVDRLLILHTSIGQELGGDTNRIWSHYTTFDEVIELPGDLKIGHYTMASLATGENGFGTMMHEMLHQLGAYDLYPSHGSSNQYPWKGLGDWDIMANGNWNGGGKWPAIPSASTLVDIGGNSFNELDMSWIDSGQEQCNGPNMILESRTRGGDSMKMKISQHENIWIEYRESYGFDSYLPGEGVLVTYQDMSVGDFEDNELNTNPNRPYLSVVEADENNALKTGLNDGESTDLFTDGMKFGNKGVPIRNHDGFLVPWTVNIDIQDQVYVNLSSDNCNQILKLDAPDHGASLLPNENLIISMISKQNCLLNSSLTSSDGRVLSTNTTSLSANEEELISFYFSSMGNTNSEAVVSGTISCGDSMLDLRTKITTLGRRPVTGFIEGEIGAYGKTVFEVLIDSQGTEMQRFNLEIDGPMSRITTVESTIDLDGNDVVSLIIEPNGLLSPNMLVKGELEFYDTSGEKWTIELELTAKNDESNSFRELITPGITISIACLLAALWVILGIKERTKNIKNDEHQTVDENIDHITSQPQVELDAWGRPLDEF